MKKIKVLDKEILWPEQKDFDLLTGKSTGSCELLEEGLKDFDTKFGESFIRGREPDLDLVTPDGVKEFIRDLVEQIAKASAEEERKTLNDLIESYACEHNWDYAKAKQKATTYVKIFELKRALTKLRNAKTKS